MKDARLDPQDVACSLILVLADINQQPDLSLTNLARGKEGWVIAGVGGGVGWCQRRPVQGYGWMGCGGRHDDGTAGGRTAVVYSMVHSDELAIDGLTSRQCPQHTYSPR